MVLVGALGVGVGVLPVALLGVEIGVAGTDVELEPEGCAEDCGIENWVTEDCGVENGCIDDFGGEDCGAEVRGERDGLELPEALGSGVAESVTVPSVAVLAEAGAGPTPPLATCAPSCGVCDA